MKKILQVMAGLDGGGVENILYNYYSNMNIQNLKMDIIVHGKKTGKMEDSFKKLGCNIYHVTPKKEGLFKNFKEINRIIKRGNYDVIHCRQDYRSFFPIFSAKLNRVKTRIVHCHIAYQCETLVKRFMRLIFTWLIKTYSTHYFACSADAAKWLYGKRAFKKGRINILNNAINVDKFSYNEGLRNEKRKELGLENKFVIGTVARFTYQKNHEFLIQIFKIIHEKCPNSILLLTGKDELEQKIRDQVNSSNLTESVYFLGIRDDINELMQVMDVFLLPTRYEGWGNVFIEAQASGLKCITSKDVVPKETKITDCIEYISLDTSAEDWAKSVLKYINGYKRTDKSSEIRNAGFDINQESNKLERFYSYQEWER